MPNTLASIAIHTDNNLAKIKDVEEIEEKRGLPVHPICKYCVCNGVPVVYTKRGRKNWLEESNEKKRKIAERVAYLGKKQKRQLQEVHTYVFWIALVLFMCLCSYLKVQLRQSSHNYVFTWITDF